MLGRQRRLHFLVQVAGGAAVFAAAAATTTTTAATTALFAAGAFFRAVIDSSGFSACQCGLCCAGCLFLELVSVGFGGSAGTALAAFGIAAPTAAFAALAFLGLLAAFAALVTLSAFAAAFAALLLLAAGGFFVAFNALGTFAAFATVAAAAAAAGFAIALFTASAAAALAASFAVAAAAFALLGWRGSHRSSLDTFGRALAAAEPAHDAGEQAFLAGNDAVIGEAGRTAGAGAGLRCGLAGRDAFDRRFLTRWPFAGLARLAAVVFSRLLHHLVAGDRDLLGIELVVAQADDFVRRRFEVAVGNDDQLDAVAQLDAGDVDPLLVEQEGGDIDRHLQVHCAGVFLHCFFFEDAQDVQRGRFGAADVAGAVAARAGDVAGFGQRRAQALPGKFEQAEAADLAGLHAGAVMAQGVAQTVFDFALVFRRLHVDEVDDDQAAKVTQAQLAGDFLRRFEVGAQCGFLDVGAFGGAAGVDVDRHQRFSMVDDHRTAGR